MTDKESVLSANPDLYRVFRLPKKSGGYRIICAPSSALLSAQRRALPEFEKAFRKIEKQLGLGKIAHGFIRGRSPVTGAHRHIGYDTTIMMDISNFFDTVSSKMVADVLKQYDGSPELTNAYFVDGYLAQGFATSPMLATLAILPTLKTLKTELNRKYQAVITCYADDIQVSFNLSGGDQDTGYDIEMEIRKFVEQEFGKLGLKINHKKTRVRYAKFGYRRVLGVNVGDDHIRATRKTMRKIRAAAHQGNGRSLGGLRNWANCPMPK